MTGISNPVTAVETPMPVGATMLANPSTPIILKFVLVVVNIFVPRHHVLLLHEKAELQKQPRFITAPAGQGLFLQPRRLRSAAFEATPAFATAKAGGGLNVRCNDLLGVNCTTLNRQIPGVQPAPGFHCDEGTKA
jgi:hypothetical protein